MDVNAAKNFLEDVVTEHVLSAAMTYLGISTLDECHQISHFPQDWMEDDRKRIHLLRFLLALSIHLLTYPQH